MPDNLYLIRQNRQWVQYSQVVDLNLTGVSKFYTDVTGTAATDRISVSGGTLEDGDPFFFRDLVGGAGLSNLVTYWAVNAANGVFRAAATPGGPFINFTTDITAGTLVSIQEDLYVWSTEYRNTFQSSVSVPSAVATGQINESKITSPGTFSMVEAVASFVVVPGSPQFSITPTYEVQSDEVAGAPLRQDPLRKTHWKFDRGGSITPRFLYAEWLPGDAIADNPPNTVVPTP